MFGLTSRVPRWVRTVAPAVGGVLVGLIVITLFAVFGGAEDEPPAAAADAAMTKQDDAPTVGRRSALRIRIERKDIQARKGRFIPLRPAPTSTPQIDPAEPAEVPPRMPPWRRFAVAAPDAGDRPLIAVIIDDMGLDRVQSAAAIALPGPLTLSFMPYANDLVRQVAAARSAGHELMLHVSMEPETRHPDAGPNMLAAGLGAREVIRRLDWAMQRFTGYVGVNNHMGSGFTTDDEAMALVLGEIKRRGLLFIDSRTTTHSVAPQTARILDLPFAERDVFIDDDATPEVVSAQLSRMEKIARMNGAAIAIGHPREATLEALRKWLPSLAGLGFVLVPVSALVKRRRQASSPSRAAN